MHFHARNPEDGRPTPDPAVFMQFLPGIKQSTDAVINITTGGSLGMTHRAAAGGALRAKPELCSLNMGSMNFGIFPLADRYKKWKHDWEEPICAATDDFIFRNTFGTSSSSWRDLGEGCGTRFEFECYDVGHLYNLAHFLDRGSAEAAALRADDLRHSRRHRRRHRKPDHSCGDRRPTVRRRLSSGRSWPPAATRCRSSRRPRSWAATSASGWRTASISAGQACQEQRRAGARRSAILEELSLEVATPAEAREMLKLKGAGSGRRVT